MQARDKPVITHILQNTPEFLPHEVPVAEELIDAYLDSPVDSGYYVVVAETDGKVCGYACYGETPLTEGTWDIYWIAVEATQQGKGIGKALMKETEDRIKERGGRLAVLETSSKPNYDKTRRFYASMSYTEVACVPDFYAVGDDKLILMKRLR
jgi:ribosomal protein S18 acetylase RimI-like enzyme